MACGGHGYSQASAFPEIYSYAVGGCTYEGENIVMLLQVARSLMKIVEKLRNGSSNFPEICNYIAQQGLAHSKFTSWDSYTDADIVHDFEHVARKQIFRAYEILKKNQRETTREEAWNRSSIELCRASRAHVRLYLVKNFLKKVATCSDATIRSPLTDLTRLYAFDIISHAQGDFLKVKIFLNIQITLGWIHVRQSG